MTSIRTWSIGFCLFLLLPLATDAQGPLDSLKNGFLDLSPHTRLPWLLQNEKSYRYDTMALSWILHQLGNYYYEQGHLDSAIYYTKSALDHRAVIHDADGILVSTFNLGLYHGLLGNYQKSNAFFGRLLDPVNRKTGVSFFQLGRNYVQLNDIDQAGKCFHQAAQFPPFSDSEAYNQQIQLEYSEVLLKTQYKEYVDTAGKILSHLNEAFLDQPDDQTKALLYNRLGLFHSYQGQLDSSLYYWKNALDINEKCCQDPQFSSDILTNMAIAFRRLQRIDQAINLHEKALTILGKSSSKMDKAIIFDNLTRCYIDEQNFAKALEYSNKALQTLSLLDEDHHNVIDTSGIEHFPYKYELFHILLERAEIFKRTAKDKNYLDVFHLGERLLNLMSFDQSTISGQMKFRQMGESLYSGLIHYQRTKKDTLGILLAIESSKSFILKQFDQYRNTPKSSAQDHLQNKIRALEIAHFEEASKEKLTEIIQLKNKLSGIQKPIFTQTNYLSDIRDNVSKEKAILLFSLEESQGSAIHIYDGKIKIWNISGTSTLAPMIDTFVQACSNIHFPERSSIIQNLGKALFTALFHALPSSKRPLIVIPDGTLHQLPMGALIDEGGFYLSQRRCVTYASSLYHLKTRPMEPLRSIGFVAPNFVYLDSLQYVKKEGDAISEHFRCIPLNDLDSLWRAVRSKEIKGLHFATHGTANNSHPEYGYLYLNDSTKLYLREVWGQPMNQSLVVIGACDGGQGKTFKREGQLSLGEGFISAGCPNVVLSKWKVDDYAGSILLSNFYSYLSKSRSVGKAFHLSLQNYLRSTNPLLHDPYYWAGWTVYEGTEVNIEKPFTKKITILLIILIIGMIMALLVLVKTQVKQ